MSHAPRATPADCTSAANSAAVCAAEIVSTTVPAAPPRTIPDDDVRVSNGAAPVTSGDRNIAEAVHPVRLTAVPVAVVHVNGFVYVAPWSSARLKFATAVTAAAPMAR